MKVFKAILFVFALIMSSAAFARAAVPIIDLLDQPADTASGKALTVEQLQQTIRIAALGRNWSVTPQANGKIQASLSWNNKHMIAVEIICKENSYSIVYKDSINMKYEIFSGQPVIHPFYNDRVGELRRAIQIELTKI